MHRVQMTRIVGLIGLAVTTSIVTASLASQMKQPARDTPRPSYTKSVTRKDDQALQQVREVGIVKPALASGYLRNATVKADGDLLIVSAEAHLRDIRFTHDYIWSMRIFDPADRGRTKPVFHWFYTENRWKIPPAEETVVNFQDAFRIPLPQKRYLVEISILRIPPGANIARLKDPAKADAWQGPASFRPVVVGQ
jgi:hypothetical protein